MLRNVPFNPASLVPIQRSRRREFMELPEPLRLAIVARLFERRHDPNRERSPYKETVQDHAELLGIHVATLERLQNAAKRAGFIRLSFNYKAGGKDQRESADKFIAGREHPTEFGRLTANLERALRARGRYGTRFKTLHLVDCGRVRGGPKVRVQHFGRLAAQVLVDLLASAKLIGITWGPTLKCTLERCDPAKVFAPDAVIFPLTGATRSAESESWISSVIVADLARRRGGRRRGPPLTLRGVWPAMPAELPPRQRQAVIDAMISSSDYVTIFGMGGGPGLVHTMDTVLTSIGRRENPWGMGRGALARIVNLTRLQELSFGDIGGVLLPRRQPRLSSAERKEFDSLRRSWIGLTAEHLGALAGRTEFEPSMPGVCVLAVVAAKALVLLWAIEHGLVNRAVVDDTLALELAKLLHIPVH